MHFERRELKSHAEPVSAAEVEVEATYFSVQFIDGEMLVPELEALVFIGRDLAPDDQGILYFQDAGSYREGIRFESAETSNAVFYAQRDNEINHIFEYERALDVLLACSLRRREQQGAT